MADAQTGAATPTTGWAEHEKELSDFVLNHPKVAARLETPLDDAPELLKTIRCGVPIVKSDKWRITFSDGSTHDL